MPDPISAIVGGTLASGAIGLYSSKKASEAQQKGADQATAATLEMFYTGREDLEPYREAGERALSRMERFGRAYPDQEPFPSLDEATLRASPGYQARLEEGKKAVERSAAARGNLLGGRALKELNRFAQDYASNEYDRFVNREVGNWLNRRNARVGDWLNQYNAFSRIAGMGQSSAAGSATQAGDVGNALARNALVSGGAQADQWADTAGIVSGGLSSGIQNYLLLKSLQQ